MKYAEQLHMFVDAILSDDPNHPMLEQIATARHNSLPTSTRLGVYRNGYEMRLVDATITDYKALKHYMGERECRAFIAEYVRATRSPSWDLNPYALGFESYAAKHSDDTALVAIVQLEAAIARTLWAPESPVLDAQVLSSFTPEVLAEQHFKMRTASQLLHLPCGAESYVHAFRKEEPLEAMPEAEEYVLVLRHPYNVYRHMLEPVEYELLKAVEEGGAFGEILEAVASKQADGGVALVGSLPNYLSRWLQEGFFAAE